MSEPAEVRELPAAEQVDLDLDTEDALLREAVGQPTTVRIGGTVIEIEHASGWTSEAMRAGAQGNWDVWAECVIPDRRQLRAFKDANLKNYQVEAVFEKCGQMSRINRGKSPRSATSSRGTRKR